MEEFLLTTEVKISHTDRVNSVNKRFIPWQRQICNWCILGSITSRCSRKEPADADQTRESGGNRA